MEGHIQLPRVFCTRSECLRRATVTHWDEPIKLRNYREMEMVGRRKVGVLMYFFCKVISPGCNLNTGVYYAYMCPVCGHVKFVLRKNGMMMRVMGTPYLP